MSKPETRAQLGERLDLMVRQGSTLGPYRHMLTQGGAPLDLTGCTVRAKIRPTVPGPAVDACGRPIKPEPEIVEMRVVIAADPTMGFYDFGLAAEETAKLGAGETPNSPESIHQWDSELVLADGRVVPLYYGRIHVAWEVGADG